MRNNFIFLMVGILIGAFGRFHGKAPETQISVTEVPAAEAPVVQQSSSHHNRILKYLPRPSVPSIPEPIVQKAVEMPEDLRANKPVFVKRSEPEHTSVWLSEESISDIEANFSVVRSQVRTQKNDRGWKILFSYPENYFSRLGFKDGDVIKFSSIESLDSIPNSAGLSARTQALLTSLEQ